MFNAILAVIGAALLTWAITAWREKSGTALTFRQAMILSLVKYALGVRYRGFRESAALVGPVLYIVSRQSRMDRWLLRCFLPVGTFHVGLDVAVVDQGPLIRSVLSGHGRVCVYAPEKVEATQETMLKLAAIGHIALHTTSKVVPVYIGGARNSFLSVWDAKKSPRHFLCSLTVTAAAPISLGETTDIHLADLLVDGMMTAKLRSARFAKSLFENVVIASGFYGQGRLILQDAVGEGLSYRQMLIGARVLASRFARLAVAGEAVGVLLPNASGAVLSLLGLWSARLPAAMLNYTAGSAAMCASAKAARISTVVSSRVFVEKADLTPVIAEFQLQGLQIVYLEDIRAEVDFGEKLSAFFFWRWPVRASKPDEVAVILFTSGSEGAPKGVALTSVNLLANAAQADCRIDISPEDSLFNVLPLFHSFGLLGGMVLPLLYGVKLHPYPSPLHYKMIPGVARKIRPTIMFGTDTFLMGYGRSAKDGDFDSVRLIVAGAEAVRPETRDLYLERFNCRIVEGYGMTEASPVVAVNSSTFSQDGSVGRLMPGMEMQLEPVEGLEDGKRLFVAGPNVMKGYLMDDEPGVLKPLPTKWHDTGDIVTVDERGFIVIRGRMKRFAKIAGEMVSLGAIEMTAHQLWPEAEHAAVAIVDARHGERIVLLTTQDQASKQAYGVYSQNRRAARVMQPDEIRHVAEIPRLGSGKTDYATLTRMAEKAQQLKSG